MNDIEIVHIACVCVCVVIMGGWRDDSKKMCLYVLSFFGLQKIKFILF